MVKQYLLPPCPALNSPEILAEWAAGCFTALGLAGWSFGTDRATRRLGCCRPGQKRITLSRYFLAHYLPRNPEQVRRTLLHELAHALAWERRRSLGHGSIWRHYCTALGIADERPSTACEDFAPPRPVRYTLVHDSTGEVFRTYTARPRLRPERLKHCYIPGRKADTLGHLVIRPV